jgi:PIN domain nuclease of toxin-antitoxin system
MKLLIDTHVFVWATVQPDLLSSRARATLDDADNEILLSTVSAYEIELKRDRDPALQRIPADLDLAVRAQQIHWLGVSQEHASTAGRLARLHGDPFDRIIIAQAFIERATLISRDRWFGAYGVPLIW